MVYFPPTHYRYTLQKKLALAIQRGKIDGEYPISHFAAEQEKSANSFLWDGSAFSDPEPPDLESLYRLEPQALTQVHHLYFSDIYRYARFRLQDEITAEDLTAEVFVRFIEALQARKGPKTSIKGYLMGMIANLVNDYYRKTYKRNFTELLDDIPTKNPAPDEWVEDKEQKIMVHKALQKLTADQQHVLALRFGSELSINETAVVMNRKINSVKALQFRALAALRRHLGVPNG